MAENTLQEGISILYDMELNNYLMTRSIRQLDYRIDQLGHKKTFRQPVKKTDVASVSENVIVALSLGGIAGAVVGAIYGLIIGDGFFYKLGEAIAGVINFGLLFGCIGAIIGLIRGVRHRSKDQQENDKQYLKECKIREQNIAKDQTRVNAELQEKKILIYQRNRLMSRRNEATEKLKQFYFTMGIDDRFCNLVPIGYMHEFIRLGIATKLEGADGLYYLILQELRHDQLQYTLEEISNKLDTIIDSQHTIYNELVAVNSKCDSIIRTTVQSAEIAAQNNQLLETAVQNTSLAAYNSERITKELAFQNFMLMYT